MDMLDQFLTMPMMVFCLIIWIAVMFQRALLEYKWPKIQASKLWKEIFLPFGPIGTGAGLAACIPMYPFPDLLKANALDRIFCGIVCGLLSGFVYRVAKSYLMNKMGANPTDAKITSDLP